jgi:hypothetical protein
MPDNGSGNWSPPAASFPEVPDTLADANRYDAVITDAGVGISNRICKDGQTTLVANIPFNGFKATGMGPATARTDSATLANIQDGTGLYVSTVGGTANAITLNVSPAIGAYVAGQTFRFVALATNTTATTVNISSLGARDITKNGTTILAAGDIRAGALVTITYDGTEFLLGTTGLSLTAFTGTLAQLNTAVTDADVASLAGVETLTNKTLTTPTIDNPTFTGALTISAPFTTTGGILGTLAFGKHLSGLTYTNNGADATNDIDIAVGSATSTHATPASRVLLSLNTAVTKQLDAAWVTGTNQGGLSSSLTIGNNDYYIHLIRVAGVDDIGFDTSATAANLIADHTVTNYRLIGWFKRVAGTIVAFHTYETDGGGLEMLWDVPTLDIDLADTLTTARRTDAVKVPLTFSVLARLNIRLSDTAALFSAWVGCPDQTDAAPSLTAAPLANFQQALAATDNGGDCVQQLVVRTSATGTIAARATLSTVSVYKVSTMGFTWARRN